MKKGNVVIVGVVVIGVILGTVFLLTSGKQEKKMKGQETIMEKKGEETMSNKILAGKSSQYLEFSKAEYEKALDSNKVVLLNFFANWCPVCRAETPDLYAAFNSLTTDQIVGFRVNYNDTDTDEDEKKLAQEFEIPYQHTKVILKNGKKVFGPENVSWDKETYLKELEKYLEQ